MQVRGTVKDLARRLQATVRRHPTPADAGLAVLMAAAALVSVAAVYAEIRAFDDPLYEPPGPAAATLALLGLTLPLAWRRRFPFAVAIVVVGVFLVEQSLIEVPESAVSSLAVALAIYSAAVHGRRRFRTAVLSLCLITMGGELARQLFFLADAEGLTLLAQSFFFVYNLVFFALPWVLGAAIRTLRERERELADRASELQTEREENARQAVFAERVRIARELHDIVAHHVSVMGVQAGAARRVMERQPEKAAEALSSIEASSRQALLEMHRLLGFLRRAGEAEELTPQPGLDQLDDLVAQAAQGPLRVDLDVQGAVRPLSPTLEVSAYRIVQEALTNARKHSDGSSATVRVRYGPALLEIEVVDDGKLRLETSAGADGGHGLIGMRERASLHGGHLRAGHRPEGGFGVLATFPLNGPVT